MTEHGVEVLLLKIDALAAQVLEVRKEGQRRGEDQTQLIRKLGTEVVGLEKRVSKLEEGHVVLRRTSQEGDVLQMEALTAAMNIQNRSMDERLNKQDAVLEEQTKILKSLAHPVLRWGGRILAAIVIYYLGTKGIKILP